ncbi:hypothetical protein P7K49_000558 [Saguinus oedipus]|uniref:Uncharacterized protein n=1 Tax=Saguinus oedipus TaxID=9490 RepID=A0ABQ9WC40_SAGOE|nr:hypothetical protein P7K49_000558 [Saguinus oedipus]
MPGAPQAHQVVLAPPTAPTSLQAQKLTPARAVDRAADPLEDVYTIVNPEFFTLTMEGTVCCTQQDSLAFSSSSPFPLFAVGKVNEHSDSSRFRSWRELERFLARALPGRKLWVEEDMNTIGEKVQ